MKTALFFLYLMSFLLFLTTSNHAQNNANYSELVKECENIILKKMEADKLVGVSGAIIIDDSVIWKKGFGFADKENDLPMTVNTAVNIASVTKTFTALAIMQLQGKGLIDINQPLKK